MEIKRGEFLKFDVDFDKVHAPWLAKMREISAAGWYIRCSEIMGERDYDTKEFIWKAYIRWVPAVIDPRGVESWTMLPSIKDA